jgi:hypothetical protein
MARDIRPMVGNLISRQAARVAEARRKLAEAGLDPAIVDEAVEAARRSA